MVRPAAFAKRAKLLIRIALVVIGIKTGLAFTPKMELRVRPSAVAKVVLLKWRGSLCGYVLVFSCDLGDCDLATAYGVPVGDQQDSAASPV